MNIPLKIICKTHGEFKEIPYYHLRGSRCQKCIGDERGLLLRSTAEEFIRKARKVHGDKYDYSKVIYINNSTKVIIICPIHGEFEQIPANHLNNKGCSLCGDINTGQMLRLIPEEYISRCIKIHGDKYDYSKTIYTDSSTKVSIICRKHGKFKQNPFDHLSGKGCERCSESRGEATIAKILDDNGIRYIREYKLPQAPQYKFEYDFYLPEQNLLIEFHGIQHYRSVEFFGGEEAFKQNQFRDKFKYSLARECGYRIIYFNYKDLKRKNIVKLESKILKHVRKKR